MTARWLLWRSLWYYRRSQLLTLWGLAVALAVLMGAMMVGTSVKQSMARLFNQRLGRIQYAISEPEYVFTSDLAQRLEQATASDWAATLMIPAMARYGEREVMNVQLIGIDKSFWKMHPDITAPSLTRGQAVLNDTIAQQLGAAVGDSITLRFAKINPLGSRYVIPGTDDRITTRLTVSALANDSQFGRFSLQANQTAPLTVFVRRDWLAEQLVLPGKANILLGSSNKAKRDIHDITAALQKEIQLSDYGLHWHHDNHGQAILTTDRIFMREPIVNIASSAVQAHGILSSFVPGIESKNHTTPYSFVAGLGNVRNTTIEPSIVAPGDIILNDWLADDLHAAIGDTIIVHYWVVSQYRELIDRSVALTVSAILPTKGELFGPDLTPNFPGLTNVDTCSNWDTTLAIDMNQIRDKDEDYWNRYRATPKAIINLAQAQELWMEHQHTVTSLSFAPEDKAAVTAALRDKLAAQQLGIRIRDVRAEGRRAYQHAMDLGTMMVSLSFFVIAAALLLTTLLIRFHLQQRQREHGCLRAWGYVSRQIAQLVLAELAIVWLIALPIGVILAQGYAWVIIRIIAGLWDNIGGSGLRLALTGQDILWSSAVLSLIIFITAILCLRNSVTQSIPTMLSGTSGFNPTLTHPRRGHRIIKATTYAAALTAMLLLVLAWNSPAQSINLTLGAGFMILVTGIAAYYLWLYRLADKRPSLTQWQSLVRVSLPRQAGRHTAVAAMTALSTFLLIIVGAHYQMPRGRHLAEATGTFTYFGQSTFAIPINLNDKEQLSDVNLNTQLADLAHFTSLSQLRGDDADCTNLNQAQRPTLLGVPVTSFKNRFSFIKAYDHRANVDWSILQEQAADTPNPVTLNAVADMNTILWALGKQLGDELTYQDEQGNVVQIRLAAGLEDSILQGYLLVDKELLQEHFPNTAGNQVFLIAAANDTAATAQQLSRQLSHYGMSLEPTRRRLQRFVSVQNRYILLFEALGALALVIGLSGLGLILVRQILDRRQELAMMIALGYTHRQIHYLTIFEFSLVLASGIIIGTVSGLIAISSSLIDKPNPSAGWIVTALLLTISTVAAAVIVLATHYSMKRPLVEALRND